MRPFRLPPRTLSLVSSATFLLGSLLFLSERSQRAGVVLFVLGSAAMLLSSLREPRDPSGRA